jgi:glycosyltransferase involved in cell wall biosynthesis
MPVEPVALMRPWYPPAVLAVWRRSRRATIVHAHDSQATALAAVARNLSPGLAVVCHRRVAFPPRSVLARRWKYRRIDSWIAVSAEIASKLRHAGGFNIRVVPSAIDIGSIPQHQGRRSAVRLRSELGIGPSSEVVGLVGALDPQKGHATLVAAAPRILQAMPETIFLCVGEGRLSGRLRRHIRRAGLDGAFRLTGFRRDVLALMGLCTVVIAPSLHGEGSSAVLKEAMALGVPVIASGLPGNLEVLDGAGIAIPPNNSESLADAVIGLVRDPHRRTDLSARGRVRSALWAPRTMAAEVLAAYRDLGKVDVPMTEAF